MSELSPLVILPLAVGLAVGAVLVVRQHPRAGFVGWLAVLAFVPVWFGISISSYFQPASLVGILVAVGLAARRRRPLSVGDLVMVFFVIACLAPMVIGGATPTTIFVVLSEWLVGYLVGRLLPGVVPFAQVCSVIAVVFTIIGAWAVIEYVFHLHLFVDLGPANSLHETWGPIQGRGGQERSEGAFGHSIAIGASIALALPFVLGSRFRDWIRLTMCAVMLAGVVFTFSRIALVCSALALLLTVVFVADERVARLRRRILVLLGAAAAIAVPMLLTVFSAAGSEAAESGQYRGRLGDLVSGIDLLGFSSAASRSPSGVLRFGGFRSIDNAVLLTGLTYGLIAVIIGLVLLLIGAGALLSRRGSVATAAAVAQLPALFSVAFITQYSLFFWFVVGIAVATSMRSPQDILAGSVPAGARTDSLPTVRSFRAAR